MTSNPIVRKLGFTGSTEVGKLLMASAPAGQEGLARARRQRAVHRLRRRRPRRRVDGALICKYRNSGQTCISANRILVQDAVYDDFVSAFTQRVAKLVVADGFTPDVNVGPLIDAPGIEKVERHVGDAREHGAELLLGGARHALGRSSSRRP
jgi:succinate-semialdehyde dehydrogenase/glutarate-semialdehyde dehydrogenase